MDTGEAQRNDRRYRLFLRLGVGSLFLFAAIFPLGRFFVLSCWALVLLFFGFALHYRRLTRSQSSGDLYRELRTIPNVRPPESAVEWGKYRTVFAAAGFILFSFILIIVAVVFGSRSVDTSSEWIARGMEFYNVSQYDSAIHYFDRTLEVEPDNTLALYNKGLALYEQKSYQNATIPLSNALVIEPDYSQAMLLLGDCYYNMQSYEPALGWYTRAYDLGERSANLSHLLAYLYDNKGETDQAVTFYRETLSMDSSRVEIYERLVALDPGREGIYYKAILRWQPASP